MAGPGSPTGAACCTMSLIYESFLPPIRLVRRAGCLLCRGSAKRDYIGPNLQSRFKHCLLQRGREGIEIKRVFTRKCDQSCAGHRGNPWRMVVWHGYVAED